MLFFLEDVFHYDFANPDDSFHSADKYMDSIQLLLIHRLGKGMD